MKVSVDSAKKRGVKQERAKWLKVINEIMQYCDGVTTPANLNTFKGRHYTSIYLGLQGLKRRMGVEK
jgi:hypothetical protein